MPALPKSARDFAVAAAAVFTASIAAPPAAKALDFFNFGKCDGSGIISFGSRDCGPRYRYPPPPPPCNQYGCGKTIGGFPGVQYPWWRIDTIPGGITSPDGRFVNGRPVARGYARPSYNYQAGPDYQLRRDYWPRAEYGPRRDNALPSRARTENVRRESPRADVARPDRPPRDSSARIKLEPRDVPRF